MVVANWKMHGSRAFVDAFARAWSDPPAHVDTVFCPPFGYLRALMLAMKDASAGFGVQNLSAQPAGALTGEHAAEMAWDLGARFAIVGHSERRRRFAETDADVAAKFDAALHAGLQPILCVGETAAERRSEATQAVVLGQLDAVVEHCGVAGFAEAAIAYEPVWAIGSGRTATPAEAQQVHASIRRHLTALDPSLAGLRLLYGGSVSASNAAELLAETDIDGALVGGASLDAREFRAICCAAREAPARGSEMTDARNKPKHRSSRN